MIQVSYADILGCRVALSVHEAVALVLAALDAAPPPSSAHLGCRLPAPAGILLHQGGRVTAAAAEADGPATADAVTILSSFLRDAVIPELASGRAPVPGPIVLLLARVAGTIDLPRPTTAEFVAALSRFGSADVMVLASVYRRCVRVCERAEGDASSAVERPTVIRTDGRPKPLKWRGPDRRRNGLTAAELRQCLRETERELFEARHPSRRFPWLSVGASAAAIVLTVGALVLMLGSTTTVPVSPGRAALGNSLPVRQEPAQPRQMPSAIAPSASSEGTAAESEPMPLLTAAVVGTDVFSPSYARADGEFLFHAGRAPSALMRASFGPGGEPMVATLLKDGAANFHAALSPDGHWLAYDSDRDGTRAIYVAHADGSEPRQVSGAGYAAVPRWSPDGRRLAYVKAEEQRPRVWNVWVLELATGAMSRISHHAVGQAWGPSWFADGQRIAYSVEDRLVIAGVNGVTARVLQSPVKGRLVRTPAVSPDGRAIVFQVYRDGVWLADPETGAMRRLLSDRAAEEFAWAPSGDRVIYHTQRRGAWSLWQVPVSAARSGHS